MFISSYSVVSELKSSCYASVIATELLTQSMPQKHTQNYL